MKITTKFAFLITAIIIIPMILTGIISYVVFFSIMQNEEMNRDREITHWIIRNLYKMKSVEDIQNLNRDIPEGLDVVFLDSENIVLLSSVESIHPGTSVQPDDLLARLSREYPARMQSYDPFFITGEENVKLMMSVRQGSLTFFDRIQTVRWVSLIFFILLVAGSIIGAIILGSFRRSILKLEDATKRISKGDLDFHITSRGNDEIASLTRSFDSMRGQLKEEYAKRSRFLMAVSHDLSTPLTSIKGYVEAIKDGMADNTINMNEYLAIISDRVDLLEVRISELIEFVRMETGEWQLKRRKILIRDFLELTRSIFKEDARLFKRQFDSSMDVSENIYVIIDQNLLLRAMENIFHNAIRYTEEDDTISFAARQFGDEIMLIIQDTGAGMDENELARIFDPFFRGRVLDNHNGFGLGLSIVKSILSAHGWNIRVESKKGKGTVFSIRIKNYTS